MQKIRQTHIRQSQTWEIQKRDCSQQNMALEITEPAKAAIMGAKEAENAVNTAKSEQVMPRRGSPSLKQQTVNWKAAEKYQELKL